MRGSEWSTKEVVEIWSANILRHHQLLQERAMLEKSRVG
jgi:hypothetical protein